MNFKKKGLRYVLKAVLRKDVSEVVVAYPDRLTRFGFELIRRVCDSQGVKLTVLEEKPTQVGDHKPLPIDRGRHLWDNKAVESEKRPEMQKTYEAKLSLSDANMASLNEWGRQYGSLKHKLYQWVAQRGGKCKDYKTEFCNDPELEQKLLTRQFNAIAIELQGLIDGTRELLKLRQEELKKKLKAGTAKHKRAVRLNKQVEGGKKAISVRQKVSMEKTLMYEPANLTKLEKKLEEVEKRLKANVPGICFGTRKLFNAQFHLMESGYVKELTDAEKEGKAGPEIAAIEQERHLAGMLRWKADWVVARSHQVMFVGSKDERCGNQMCQASVLRKDAKLQFGKRGVVLRLKIRRPDVEDRKGTPESAKYLYLEIALSYGHEEILAALEKGTAISYRFHRNNETMEWYIQIMTDVADQSKTSKDKAHGVLGVDFNADHLAVTQTNAAGWFVKTWVVPMELEGKTAEQREAVLSEALKGVVDYAEEHQLPIAVERLDFQAKKQQMERKSKRYRVMLSGLMYARYQQLLAAKCARAGVVLIEVNPAHTSVIGRIMYTLACGKSVHVAAAGVIARRAQELSENIPPAARVAAGGTVISLVVPERNRSTEKQMLEWYASQIRETLYKEVRAQRGRDRMRLKSRQRCSTSTLDLSAPAVELGPELCSVSFLDDPCPSLDKSS